MKKKRVIVEEKGEKVIFQKNGITIYEGLDSLCFEIGSEITNDIGEAVAILLRTPSVSNDIWDYVVDDIISTNELHPEKSLFWLSGGKKEWNCYENYIKNWNEVHELYNEEFGDDVYRIVRKSKTLRDIRNGFIKKLGLEVFYDFAIERGFVK